MMKQWRSLVGIFLVVATVTLQISFATAAPARRVPYWVVVDVVRGHTNPAGPVCVQTGVFKQGELIVWRAEVYDGATGREIGNDGKNIAEIAERGLKVTVYLENGQSIPMRYDKHPPEPKAGEPVNYFWTASWQIPANYPTGTLRWWVIVTDKTGAFVRFDPIGTGTNLPSSKLTIEKRG
jgi:hypothetical protein